MRNEFCGWYFRCQSEEHTLAVIPALHTAQGRRSASVQIISDQGSWQVPLSEEPLALRSDKPRAVLGRNIFSPKGIWLDIQTDDLTVSGELLFDGLTPLRCDIMGPFGLVPFMECRHRVFSMRHRVNGTMYLNDTAYSFHNGTGYIEGDRGRSFPQRYLWTQCAFPEGSVMLSAAEIPLGPLRFTGLIAVVWLRGREYRLATYLGARAVELGDGKIVIRQGDMTLTARLLDIPACTLQAPIRGAMTRTIRENVSCRAYYLFQKDGSTLLEQDTDRAAFEFEY